MSIDVNKVQIVAFDLFGTVFKLDRPKEEIQAYAAHIRKPGWSPLVLPDAWGELELFEDSEEGLRMLSESHFHTITMSNAPEETQIRLGCLGLFGDLHFLERFRVFKPHAQSYMSLCSRMMRESVLMVTSNETFGDLEGSRAIGMQAILLDRKDKYGGQYPRTIIELAKMLRGGE